MRIPALSLPLCAALAVGAATLTASSPARACGGFFCSTSPVDQNAERILFEVHDNGSVSATVEIAYTGDPADFSWIVPVPEVPTDISVVPASTLRLLDRATAPIIVPPPTTCSNPERGFFGPPMAAGGGVPSDAEATDDGVDVTELPSVGPYDDIVVLSSDDPEELILWLQEHDYLITEEMKPYVRQYVEEGSKFLAMRLAPDAGVQDIAPFRFTCPNPFPHVPIRLTAVAAQPEMGVLVFIAGSSRYRPLTFREILVPTDSVQFDPLFNQSNYYPLVSWLIDEQGGKAFVSELAQPSSQVQPMVDGAFLGTADEPDARALVTSILSEKPYLTRLYSRMSGWEMDDDPSFVPDADAPNVSNVHDLSNRAPIEVCPGTGGVEPVPCGTTYCGVGAVCATVEGGGDACVCGSGTAARNITAPQGRNMPLAQTVFCQDTTLNLLESVEGQVADACAGFSCGEGGSCVAVNGFPTCACEEGFAAAVNPGQPNGVTCRRVVSTFAPEQLLWLDEGGRRVRPAQCACADVEGPLSAAGGLVAGVALLAAFRRRRPRA